MNEETKLEISENQTSEKKENSNFIEDVKYLRNKTGFSTRDCADAIKECKGNRNEALAILEAKAQSIAGAKTKRETLQGTISSYVHKSKNSAPRQGALLELKCETDFVAKHPDFQTLAKSICTHIVFAKPLYISIDRVSQSEWEKVMNIEFQKILSENNKIENDISEKEKESFLKEAKEKTEQFLINNSLLSQTFFQDENLKVSDVIANHIGLFRENIKVARFERYEI